MNATRTPRRASGATWRATAATVLALPLLLVACGQDEGEDGQADTASTAGADMQQIQQVQQELQQIQQTLQPLQQQALQDSALQEMRTRVTDVVSGAMQDADPQTAEREERLNQLSGQVETARQEQDTARAQSLMQEARQLSQQLQQTQSQVMQRDSVSRMIDRFRDSLRAKMAEIDPKADSLLARQDSLLEVRQQIMQQLQAQQLQQQGQGQGQRQGGGGGPGG